jgi:hypothetical protein
MKYITPAIALVLIVLTPSQTCRAQGEVALPFLLIPPSPQANGMGGINGSTISDDPLATLSNPGQLGLTSLDHYFSGGLYPSETSWLPGLQTSGPTLSASAFNAGFRLNRLLTLPFGLSAGIGYSHVSFNLGVFGATGSDPSMITHFSSEEHSNNLTLGIGIDYYVRLGLGYTYKSVESNLAPFNVQGQGRQGVSSVTTYDLGFIAEVPVMRVINEFAGSPVTLFSSVEPLLGISICYARSNLGDEFVTYIDPAGADPLPRNAMLGLSYKAGITREARAGRWELLSFTLAREADDILVERFPPTVDSLGVFTIRPPQYADGSGSIQFVKNVILGEGNGRVTLRKGWQINLVELAFVRGGSVRGRGVSYTTSGYGFRLGGLLKLLDATTTTVSSSPAMVFILSHFDVRYDHASSTYDDPFNPNDGVTFNELSVVFR